MSLSATDFAILLASRNGTLVVKSSFSARFQEEFWIIEDDCGVIECHATKAEAEERVRVATRA